VENVRDVAPGKTYSARKEEILEGGNKQHNKKLHNIQSSVDIISMIKKRPVK
jgi:hypothetical protein